MNHGRALFTMTDLNGKLCAIGGVGTNGDLAAVERYDPDRPGDGDRHQPADQAARTKPRVLSAFGRIVVVGGAADQPAPQRVPRSPDCGYGVLSYASW
jgi:hypothetical protein